MFNHERLAAIPLIRTVEVHRSLASTNDHAKQHAASDNQLPLLIVAEEQTAGRGRGNNRWSSTSGALTFSLLLQPSAHGLSGERVAPLSIASALALCDAIDRLAPLDPRPQIKWPNDVWIDDRKLAGILLESPRSDRLVIGIGVNVESHPAIRGGVHSISLAEAGLDTSPQQLLVSLLEQLALRMEQLASGAPELAEAWNDRSLLTGRRATIALPTDQIETDRIEGECLGLGPQGELRIWSDEGKLHELISGTVVKVG